MVKVDFDGPITYKIKEKKEGKVYIIRFCDSLSGTLYLEILKDQTLIEFLKSVLQDDDAQKIFTQTTVQHL